MFISKRTVAAAAALAFATLTVAAPTALAGGDRDNDHHAPARTEPADPTTCADALTSLVNVRTVENGMQGRITILEHQNAEAQAALAKAERDDADARTVEAATLGKLHNAEANLANINSENPKGANWQTRQAAAVQAVQVAQNAYDSAHADRLKADAALVKARQDAERTNSALVDLRYKLNGEHGIVLHLTVLANNLCATPAPPVPTPAPPVATDVPAPPATDVPAPPVDNGPAPIVNNPVIINNPQIGQVPTESQTGGGSMADSVE